MRTIFDIYVFIMASKYFYSIIRHSQIYSLTSLHEIWGQLFIDSLMATTKNDCKSKYLFWRRVHTTGTLLGRRKDKNGRPYLSITIH